MRNLFLLTAFGSAAIALSALEISGREDKSIPSDMDTEMAKRRIFIQHLGKKEDHTVFLKQSLNNPDPLIRKKAIYEYYKRYGATKLSDLSVFADEKDLQVIKLIRGIILDCPDRKAAGKLRRTLEKPLAFLAQQEAGRDDPNFPFRRKNIRLQDRPDWDFEVVKIGGFTLPADNWFFHADKDKTGHRKNFHADMLPSDGWLPVKLGDWTSYQGYKDYSGIGWYRGTFFMPAKMPDTHAVELFFHGVDEDAWVFVNGIFIGSYQRGKKTLHTPFRLDITNEIKWNSKNNISVRISGSRGGITKPIEIEILK